MFDPTGSFVIARNTAFSALQIGKELGVRYVMEGSVQRRPEPSAYQCGAYRRREQNSQATGASAIPRTMAWLLQHSRGVKACLSNWPTTAGCDRVDLRPERPAPTLRH